MVLALDMKPNGNEPTHYFKRREAFPYHCNHLWRIESGIVRTITWDTQGNIFVLGIWSTGDVVGQRLSDSECYRIECLSPVMARPLSPSYYCHRGELLSYLRRTEKLLQISQMRSVSERLAYFLDYCA
ncbi:MAG: Crp/Fnr family transcriptional regulator, partial [Cyanobacteria bacterium P01_A01_bin.37]